MKVNTILRQTASHALLEKHSSTSLPNVVFALQVNTKNPTPQQTHPVHPASEVTF